MRPYESFPPPAVVVDTHWLQQQAGVDARAQAGWHHHWCDGHRGLDVCSACASDWVRGTLWGQPGTELHAPCAGLLAPATLLPHPHAVHAALHLSGRGARQTAPSAHHARLQQIGAGDSSIAGLQEPPRDHSMVSGAATGAAAVPAAAAAAGQTHCAGFPSRSSLPPPLPQKPPVSCLHCAVCALCA